MIDSGNPINWAHPLAQNMQAWWLCIPGLMRGANFWNIASTIDTTLNHYKGVLTNFATQPSGTSGWNGTDRRGGFGHISLDGVNDLVVMGNVVQGTYKFTLTCWVNVQAHLDAFDTIISQSNASQNFDLLLNQTTHVFAFYLGALGQSVVSTTVPAVGTWYHVAVVWDGQTCFMFVNGHLEGTTGGIDRNTPSGTFELGGSTVFGRPANILIDDVRLYQYPMTPTQVSVLFGNSTVYNQGLLNDSNVPYAGQFTSVVFRRTLSAFGARVGSRQQQG